MKLRLITAYGLKKLAVMSLAATLGVGGAVGCGGDDEGSGGSGGGKGGTGGTGGGKGGTGGTGGSTGGSGGSTGGSGGSTGGTGGTGGIAGAAGQAGAAGAGGSTGGTGGTGGSTGGTGGSTGGTGGSTGGSGGTGGTVLQQCATPTFAPPPATSYTTAQSVVISTTTPGATIYYTTDGTNPNQNSVVYSAPIAIGSGTTTLRAMCNVPGSFADSIVAAGVYTVTPPPGEVVAPTPNPAAGTQNNDFLLSLTTSTPAAIICFTLDGSTPTCTNGVCQGTAQTYNSQTQVPINGNVTNAATGEVTVNAVACKAGSNNGVMPAQKYTLQVETPQLNGPPPGQFDFETASTAYNPLLSSATTGAVTARFTTTVGTPPSCTSGTLVNAGANLPVNWAFASTTGAKTWLFAACKAGYKGSAVYTANYSWKLKAPTQTDPGATYNVTKSVTIGNAANAGAGTPWTCTTKDGTTPACGATASACSGTGSNSASIAVTTTGTVLKSIACSLGYVASEVTTSAAYTLQLDPLAFTPPTGTPVNSGTGNISVNITQNGSGQAYGFICYSKTAAVPDCTCTASGLTKVNGNAANGVVMTPGTLSAIACGTGFLSASGSASYQAASVMAAPVITPGTSTQNDWVDVTMANADTARIARICYTTDGSEPNVTASCTSGNGAITVCTGAIPVAPGPGNSQVFNDLVKATNVTVKAKACDVGAVKSLSATTTATYQLKVATPTLKTGSPAPGSVAIGSSIAWESATVQASPVQFYWKAGAASITDPDCLGGGNGTLGTGYHMVTPANTTIKVIACSPQMTPSDVATWTYSYFLQQPTVTPPTGNYNDYVLLTLTNPPSDSILAPDGHSYHGQNTDFFCYTGDASTPTCNAGGCGFGSQQITCGVGGCQGWFTSGTFKAIACSNNGLPASAVTTVTYNMSVAPIVWAPDPAATYSTPQAVSLTVTPTPLNLTPGYNYTVCTAKGAVSIPPQPNTCAPGALKTYLDANTPGVTWTCTQPTTSAPVSVGNLTVTTTVSAVACKDLMVWSTSQKTYSFNPFAHTITIDGAEDFNDTNEALTTSGGDTAYLSWDATKIYYGYQGFSFGTAQTVDMYFGASGGTTTADGGGLASLQPAATYHLVWSVNTGVATMRKWSGSAWAADATVPVTVGYTGGTSTYVEFSFTRASIGNPTVLTMAGGLQAVGGGSYVSSWPNAAPMTQAYFVELLGAAVPNASAIVP